MIFPRVLNKNRLLFFIIVICAALPIVTLAIHLYKYAVDVPRFDQWRMLNFFEKHYDGSLRLKDFFELYTEHRPMIAELLFFKLGLLTRYNILYEIWLGALLAFLAYMIIVWHINRNKEVFNIEQNYRWLWVFFAFFIFSLAPVWSWLTAWTTCIYHITLLALFLGAFLLSNYPITIFTFIGIFICGIFTTFSTPEGILYWPIIFFFMFFKKNLVLKIKNIFFIYAWLIVSSLVLFFYFKDWHPYSGHCSISFGLHHSFEFVKYITAHIGNPLLAEAGSVKYAITLGVVGVFIFLYASIYCLRKESYIRRERFLFFLIIGLYSFLTAVLRAIGRSGFGVRHALTRYYITLGILLWLSVFFIVYTQRPQMLKKTKIIFYILRVFLLSGVFIAICLSSLTDSKGFFKMYVENSYARNAIQTGVDIDYAVYAYPFVELLVNVEIPRLKRFGFSMFRPGAGKIKELPKDTFIISSSATKEVIERLLKSNHAATSFSIDIINKIVFEGQGHFQATKNDFIISKSFFTVEGWAIDDKVKDVASGVIITIDDVDYLASYGLKRDDVARAFKVKKYKNSGFLLRLLSKKAGLGPHTISIKIISKDGNSYYESVPCVFDLISS